jgi:hypothetical protein
MRCYIPDEYAIPVNHILGRVLEFSYGVIEGRLVILSKPKLQIWNGGPNTFNAARSRITMRASTNMTAALTRF